MVVLDDLDHAKVEEKERILRTQPSIKDCSSLLLLIANKDKQSDFLSQIDAISQLLNRVKHQSSMGNFPAKNHGRSKQTHSSDDGASLESSRKNLKLDIPCSQKHSVGVFSRCAKINYKWLVVKLESKAFGSLVKEVHAVEISNDVSHFLSAVNNCTFAILYHSQNHGRLNIIGVPDSLYDRELKTLFQSFGKKKVIVVIDDLKDSSAEVKRNILHEQKSIEQFSQELLLFSETEKARINTSDTVYSKLEKLKQILETSCDFTENRAQPRMSPVAAECVSAQQLMLEDLKKEMSNQTQQIKDLKNGMSNQTQHIVDLKKEMSNKTQHIEDLKKEMSNQTQHIEDLKKEMSNQTQHIENLKKEMSNKTQHIEDLKKEMSNQTQHIENLKKEMSNKTQHIEDLKKEMSNQTQHIEDLKKEMSNKTQKTEELKKELPNQAQQIDKLNKEDFQQSQL
ncbi:golgin subfamily A member 6-like protein 7 isoform X2 [Xenopus laevis]|nr:golgin subfamily A member 6-like protein 7 isoform X2 [Xenopus laevis]